MQHQDRCEEDSNFGKLDIDIEPSTGDVPQIQDYTDLSKNSLPQSSTEDIKAVDSQVCKDIKPMHQSVFADDKIVVTHQSCEDIRTIDQENNGDNEEVNVTSDTEDSRGSSVSLQQSPSQSDIPVPTLLRKVGCSLKSLPLGLPCRETKFRRRRKKFKDIYIPPPRDVYFESLGLLQTPKVVALSKSPRKGVTDQDCQVIDLTSEDSQPVPVPLTPRTRSLMSQLSYEEATGRRRQLSFSQTLPVRPQEVDVAFTKVKKEKEITDSESSEESEEERQIVRKVPSKSAILGIPLTSPLGQRLKQHWNSEHKVPVISEIEKFCKTETSDVKVEEKLKVKNPIVEKLRNRPPPQVTFKFSKKYINKWFHSYKFNRADRAEFQKKLRYGLERESRRRLKQMKPCKVVLQRISKKDIKYWTNPRPRVPVSQHHQLSRPQQWFKNSGFKFGQRPSLFSHRKYTPPMISRPQLVVQRIGGVSLPNRFAAPTPQLLVRTVPLSGQGMQVQVSPLMNVNSAVPLSHSQKRKQVFTTLKQDDMVICLSSDEEEDPLQTSCASSSATGGNQIRQNANHNSNITKTSDFGQNLLPTSFISGSSFVSGSKNVAQNQNMDFSHVRIANGKAFITDSRNSPSHNSLVEEKEWSHVRIANGKALVTDPVNTSSQNSVELENKNTDVAEEGENLDFEIICIDSEDEN